MHLIKTAVIAIALFVLTGCQREIDSTPVPPVPPPATKPLTILSFSPDSAQVGEVVVLTGKNFDTSLVKNQVTVNGTPATILQVNDSVLRFRVSPNTTTGKIVLISGVQTATTAQDLNIYTASWIRKADFPFASSNGFSTLGPQMTFSSATAGYVLRSQRLWKYNPTTDSWSEMASLPSPNFHNFGMYFTIGNKAYIGLGSPGPASTLNSMTKAVWEYNMDLDSWTRKKDFPGRERNSSFSFALANSGYVGGGDTTTFGYGTIKDFWKYSPQTDSWSQLPDYPGAKPIGSLGFALQNMGYVFEGGYGSIGAIVDGIGTFRLWSFNPETNVWQQRASFAMNPGKEATSATAFALNDFGYAAIGVTDTTNVNGIQIRRDFWQYDPGSNQWNQKPQTGGPGRWFPLSFAVAGKGYVGLGSDMFGGDRLLDLWQYNPQ